MKIKKVTRRQFMQVTSSLFAVGTLAACGATEATSSTGQSSSVENSQSTDETAAGDLKELSVYWWGNQVRNEGTQAILDLYSEQNENVEFDAQFAEWSDYWTKLATSAASHTMPDIIQMDYSYINQYVGNELLVDLTPYISDGTLDTSGISPGIMEASTINGGVYAICIGVNAPTLIYNKTLLDEHNLSAKDNMTVEEFMALSKEIYEVSGVKTDVAFGSGDTYLPYLIRSEGKHLYEGESFGIQSSDAFDLFFEIAEKGITEGWLCSPEIFVERVVNSAEQAPLVMGNSAEQRSWCWFAFSNQLGATQSAADAEGIELAITTLPSPNPTKSNYLKPSQFFSVTVDSEAPQEAVKVIDFVTNSVECNEILMAERGIPASSVTAEAILPLMSEVQQKVVNYINNVATPNSSAISPSSPQKASEVTNLINTLQEQVWYQQISAKDASKKLYEDGLEILAD